MEIIKTIFSIKDAVLGEIFVTPEGSFGFFHVPTQTEETNFADFDSAVDAWHCFHEDYFENLPR